MKRLLFLFLIIIYSCEKENPNYNSLLNKHISNIEVQNFLETLGSDYKLNDSHAGANFYIYESIGVELNLTKSDTLKAIFFKIKDLKEDISLPYNLKSTDTRKLVEEKINKPDNYFVGLNNLKTYYFKKGLVITYKSKDTINLNNGIKEIGITKINEKAF